MKLAAHNLDVSVAGYLACRGLSFALESRRSLAILGRNGAGKSTLLTALAGLRDADAGHVELDGKSLASYAPRDLARLRGYCAQQHHDAFAATVIETALIGRHPHLGRWDWESSSDRLLAADALAQVGLAGLAQRQVQTLSGGERQRLAIATLLVQAPRLLLLDEPLAHLDLNHAMTLLALLRRTLKQGNTLVAVMHEPNLALRHFDDALLLFGNGEWLHGTAHDVITAESLQRLYGHPLSTLDDRGRPWFVPT